MNAKSLKTKRRFALFIIILIILLVFLALSYSHKANKYRFTVEKWHEYDWNDKQLLIKDFLKQYDLYEMSKSEIIEILGDEPDFYEDFVIRYKSENNLVYDFGAEIKGKFHKSSNISLVIHFDRYEKVTDYRLVTYSW